MARALVNRGVLSDEDIQRYLNPRLGDMGDPSALPDMDAAVERLWRALKDEEAILVYGDYDVDGVTSTVLMVRVLRDLGGNAQTFIPHRIRDGYGLSPKTVDRCLETYDPRVIITVDCGTGSVDAVQVAKDRCVDVIVTDHHIPGEGVADAFAMVNPKRGTDEALMKLAGVGVAFKLCHALVKEGRRRGVEAALRLDLRQYTYLAAMGTIADVVPLQGENRILVRSGLRALNRSPSPGMRALIRCARIKGFLSGHHIGFMLGPRINAAGRMSDPSAALNLLLEDDPAQAEVFAEKLNEANRKRQETEQAIYEAAVAHIEADYDSKLQRAIVVGGDGWHPGVVGIVASRLVGTYNRPSIVIGFDEEGKGKGSCRSVPGFDLVEALGTSSDFLEQYGGHKMAAGLEVRRENFSGFAERFNAVASEGLDVEDLMPRVRVDGWLEPGEIREELYRFLQRMAPFGCKNPRPVWAARALEVSKGPFRVADRHLKLYFEAAGLLVEGFGFNMANRRVRQGERLNVLFTLQINTYRGLNSLQMALIDFETVN